MQQQQQRALTRQGVPNLNGPKMDGRYNGRRIKCDHYKDPAMPTYSVHEERRVMREQNGEMLPVRERVKVYYCENCGEERFHDGD